MSKRAIQPQTRRHILVFDDDWEFLDRSFGSQLGVSAAIRQIIHLKCNELRARVQRRVDALPPTTTASTNGALAPAGSDESPV